MIIRGLITQFVETGFRGKVASTSSAGRGGSFDAELAGSRLHPPQHGSFVVAVIQDREFAFLVGLEALIGVATALPHSWVILVNSAGRSQPAC
jgi:hypothetical protein